MTQSTFKFLRDLRRNNNREWFHSRQEQYQAARLEVVELVTAVHALLVKEDADLSIVDPTRALFRINRDIRFSANKSPYKTNFGAFLSAGGKTGPQAGYYLHFEPGSSILAGGCWMPEPEALSRIRQEIDYNLEEFQSILKAPAFRKHFGELDREGELTRPPRGYTTDNPALYWLRLKSFTASCILEDAELMAPRAEVRLAKKFSAMVPLVLFLNRALAS